MDNIDNTNIENYGNFYHLDKNYHLWYDGMRLYATDDSGREVAHNATSLITMAFKIKNFKLAVWAMNFAFNAGWINENRPYLFKIEDQEEIKELQKIIKEDYPDLLEEVEF